MRIRLTTARLFLEPRRFLRAAGDVARAVRMRPGPGEVTAGDNQVFLADGAPLEPAFQISRTPAAYRAWADRLVPDTCGVIPWCGMLRQG
jgi:hypothetical protein